MENLIIAISIIFGIIGLALIIWILIYSLSPSINGKEYIEKYMSDKYGEDWLDQCMQALKDKEVRRTVRETLKLGEYDSRN